ncbi:DUF4159 domain-containing protein [Methylocystis bryophila]|uniref:LytTR family transcriptional regulator n=1 Tax=Methylocystis bryophila TaxID=655015 RepID=A0A1W6MYM5_9HYPH|nr:DUF4159 domain-containing protein [Methylocystis bryophila]ARN82685.1 LytTR family transcriptional regulator [Methylocystis bryophila]BDV38906.1 LytTR family transcriptional regulator [Methylocystis bryophila]
MGLTFAAPLALLGLLALPLIYWLLRLTPPAPREVVFAPIAILRKLAPQERASAVTPWPLLLLRLAIAAAVALAMAGPVWNFSSASMTNAPLLLVLDDGWDAAPTWERRMEAARSYIDAAARSGGNVALLAASEAALSPEPTSAARAEEQLAALRPKPFLPARGAVATRLAAFAEARRGAHIVWIASPLDGGGAGEFVETLRAAGRAGASLELLTDARQPLALADVSNGASALEVSALSAGASASGVIEALDDKGRAVAQKSFAILAGQPAKARFELPAELRNQVSLLRISGEAAAGAVALLDASQHVRRVAIVTGGVVDRAQPLLSPTHYLERALQPFSQIFLPSGEDEDQALAALDERPDLLILADAKVAPGEAYERLSGFVEKGGVLLRFAGPRLANDPDDLTPARLRRNGRVLGGAMSWEEPKRLASFDETSPFFGLSVPDDVSVSRQILAEPDPGLADRTWARLADGTPLVTFERRGAGLIVMFHISADPSWSNLPMSGLFVEILRRISAEARETAGSPVGGDHNGALPPWRSLDGFGAIVAPPPTAKPLPPDFSGPADAEHPPGFYGAPGALRALQTLAPGATLHALDLSALGLPARPLETARDAFDLRGPLLVAIVMMLLLDWLALLWLSGRLRFAPVALALVCGLAFAQAPPAPRAETPVRQPPARDREAALKTRLAYVASGDPRIDEATRLGLETLTRILAQRTSFSGGDPAAVDPARDALSLYPMIYWPISPAAPQPSAQAKARLVAYMKQGGMIVFDTRDALTARANAQPTPEALWLRELARGLDIPELEVAPRDHVITKTFYLLESFVGRYTNGETYVEALAPEPEEPGVARPVRATDSVSPVVIVSNDLAGAWAEDKNGEPLYPLVPGAPRQREMALRGGVNLVMYTLTGNYKSDQVHVHDLLQRLGQ